MNLRRLVSLLTLLLVAGMPFSALSRDWEMDRAHSNIYFSIEHLFSKIRGHFDDFSAQVRFDEKDLDHSSFIFTVNSSSVNTNLAKRDKHLQSKDFFESRAYPEIRFVSSGITDKGEGRFDVAGKLTVKGKDYNFVLPLRLVGIMGHPAVKGKDVIGLEAAFPFDRLAYGVGGGKFVKMGIVGQEVEVLVSLELLAERE